MIRWLLERYIHRWAIAHFSIRPEGQPYIERYAMRRPIGDRRYLKDVGVFLQEYLGADGDRHLHNHPWTWAIGIPLVGGYTEERLVHLCPFRGPRLRMRNIWRFCPNLIMSTDFHRIAVVKPRTWTLFIHGRRLGGWGFLADLPPNAYVFHQTDPQIRKYTLEKLERMD